MEESRVQAGRVQCERLGYSREQCSRVGCGEYSSFQWGIVGLHAVTAVGYSEWQKNGVEYSTVQRSVVEYTMVQ